MTDQTTRTRWHTFLGVVLEHLLTPVGIHVSIDAPVMSEPPKSDILLLRRDTDAWTLEQAARLADGLRDTDAKYLLLEFKYTESLNLDALQQTLGYEYFYRKSQQLQSNELQCFLLSAKSPRPQTLQAFGYTESEQSGVYHSTLPLFDKVTILLLNDLANTEHNAWIRFFASRRKHKAQAANILRNAVQLKTNQRLFWLLNGLFKLWFAYQEDDVMALNIRLEDVSEEGRILDKVGLNFLTLEERLEGVAVEDMLRLMTVEERLRGLEAAERLQGLGAEERLQGLGAEERLQGLGAEERLQGLEMEEKEALLKLLQKELDNPQSH